MVPLLLCAFILFGAVSACRIDDAIQGVFKRQLHSKLNLIFGSSYVDPIIYDEITISATSISDFGDCYEKFKDSYVLGMRRMGRPVCYRCVTPILRSTNILQLAHQQGGICYEDVNEAKSSCFDAAQVSLGDGIIVLRANEKPAACHIDGRFFLEYSLKGVKLRCEIGSGSEIQNCQSSNVLTVNFRNCTFPDFDMSMKCIGSFIGPDGARYIVVENEETEEYRCGLLLAGEQSLTLHFSKDSSCNWLNENSSYEIYKLHPVQLDEVITPCQFPSWLQGEYDTFTVTADSLLYSQTGQGIVAVVSRCVQSSDDRFLVYSETKCGEPLGYHCLWFSPRSESLVEFKSTTPREDVNSSTCSADNDFSHYPWSAAVVNNAIPTPCGIVGNYTTSLDVRTQDCYSVSVDCDERTIMKITASRCTDGAIFYSHQYQCIASWKDGKFLYMYTKRNQETHACFVAEYPSGRLYLASTGVHCARDFNYSLNAEKTMILQEEAGCQESQKHLLSGKAPAPAASSSLMVSVDPSSHVSDRGSILFENETVDGAKRTSEQTSGKMCMHALLIVVLCMHYSLY